MAPLAIFRRATHRPFEETLAWRLISFVFGVGLPALLWGWIAWVVFEPRPENAEPRGWSDSLVFRASAFVVAFEIVLLGVWLLRRPRTARSLRFFAIAFGAGALFAAGWSVFSVLGLVALLGEPEQEMLWKSPIGVVFALPFACAFVYAVHARVAAQASAADRAA